ELKEVPFIMLTEMQEEFNERYKSTYGIIGFLRKPVNADELVSKTVSLIPLEGEAGADALQVSESAEESADDVWQSEEFEEKDAGELAAKSLDKDGKIKIKIKVKDDEEFKSDLDETLKMAKHQMDEGVLEQTAHEAPKDQEGIFAGVEDEPVGGLEGDDDSHPLDKEFVEQTSYEPPESSGDMFAAAQETADILEEKAGGEEGLGGRGDDLDIGGGPAEKELQITDESFVDEMPADLPGVSGENLDETIKEPRPSAKEVPTGTKKEAGLPKAKGKKIDEMNFDIGGIDTGKGVGMFDEFAPAVKSGRSRTIKIIAFGLLGIMIVAAATWFGLDYFGGDKRSGLSIKAVPTPKVQKKKEQVRDIVKPDTTIKDDQKSVQPVQTPAGKPVEKKVEKKVEPVQDTVVTARKEVKKPAEPVKKKPAPVVKAKYSVQVGFFKESANARNLYNKMKRKGYSVTVKKDIHKGSTIYRVLVGKYSSRDAAYRMLRKIKKIENMDAALHVL
ncbi:MAG: SPOR domain-containing protein, partial [Thermodesulfovibrionales bacterium]